MAQKTTVELIDDLDGKVASETVTFELDGRSYEIDLSEKNAAKLRKTLTPFIDSARKIRGSRQSPKRVTTDVDATAVRSWAASNGYDVSPRGRIRAEIVEAYRAAGN